ncbi:MAG: NAD-dependent epimerase/dehydratase family protein [Deltaproteobacteria bacterium]|nr:MAG: NAD-dependent epimerase/dehydratase family protein [Deltaproteobacteria bacterium]
MATTSASSTPKKRRGKAAKRDGTVLVTGASGFIGSHVVRKLLERGRKVRCYNEPGANLRNLEGLDVEHVEGDINDRERIGQALEGCDTLYHLAAIYKLWLPDNSLMYEVNVEGTKTVLFAAMKANLKKVVYTSSIAAVGQPPSGDIADETTEFNLWDESNHYVRSKWLSERDALRFAREGVPVVVVNPAFPFGERDIGPTPTGRFIVETLNGNVPGYMDGGFNVVDVDDVAEGHVLAEEKGRVGERYILGGHNVTYKEFYDLVAEIGGCKPVKRKLPSRMMWGIAWAMEQVAERTQKPPPMTYKAARYATRRLWFDTSKARNELGMPRTPLRETLDKAIRWFRANGYAN